MTNKRALEVLQYHRNILTFPGYSDYYIWQQQALSYISRMLGEDSIEYSRMKSFHFPDVRSQNYDEQLRAIGHALLTVIDQAIATVSNIGQKKEYHNFLCRYSDKELIAGSIAIITAVFGAGYGVAKLFIHCPQI